VLSALRFSVDFPVATEEVHVRRLQTTRLEPGPYTNVSTRGVLTLEAGKYFMDRFEVHREGVLELDTTGGPVIVFVRQEFRVSGTVEGAADHFLVGFLASDQDARARVETPFSGTIVAPTATLELGALAHGEHRGSFFAKNLEVAGPFDHDDDHAGRGPDASDDQIQDQNPRPRTNIVHDPFGFWHEVLNVRPLVHCVRIFKSPDAVALFGYENESDFPVTIPHGSANRLVPDGEGTPPVVFEPGVHAKAFWAPFDLLSAVTWQLAGETAVANASSPACELGDLPPEDEPRPLVEPIASESPRIPASSFSGSLAADFTSAASSTLSGPVFAAGSSGFFDLATAPGPVLELSNDEAGPVNFKFTVNSLRYDAGEGACGGVDPYVKRITINDVVVSENSSSGNRDLPRGVENITVFVRVFDEDGGLCLGDDPLDNARIEIDPYTGADDVCVNTDRDGRICFSATPIGSPDLCFDWNAQFIDAGPWTGISSEDHLQGKQLQQVPASFALYGINMTNNGGMLHSFAGVLDEKGCVPRGELPIREHWAFGSNLQVRLSVTSQLCLDSAGTRCASGAGASVVVLPPGGTGPISLCTILAENPDGLSDPACSVATIAWTNLPQSPVKPVFSDHTSVTRSAAALGHIFKRDVETDGGLGVEFAIATRPLDPAPGGLLTVETDTFCDTEDPCTNEPRLTSCRRGNSLLLEPDSNGFLSTSRMKFVIAHEFGHFIQKQGLGDQNQDYGCGTGQSPNPLCRCDVVPVDQTLHCLQSLEEPNAAQVEGYGYFFAAKAFNEDDQNDCTLVYGKPVGNTTCMPGAASCAPDAATGLQKNDPPLPVSCREQVRWRNTHCIDGASSPDVLTFGTEWDWINFFYDINNTGNEDTFWHMVNIFDAYIVACGRGPTTSAKSCSGELVSWAGNTTHASLLAGAQTLANEGFKTQAAADRFRTSGDTFGVSDNL
jgi:hypothetical protein